MSISVCPRNLPSLLPAQCRNLLLSLTSGLDAVTAAAAALAQPRPGAGPLPSGQDSPNFAGLTPLLRAASVVSHSLLAFVSPSCASEAERDQLAASAAACTGAVCVASSALVPLLQESAFASEASSHSMAAEADKSLHLAFEGIAACFNHVAIASCSGAETAALALAASLLAQLWPTRVLGWLRCAMDAVEWVVGTLGE